MARTAMRSAWLGRHIGHVLRTATFDDTLDRLSRHDSLRKALWVTFWGKLQLQGATARSLSPEWISIISYLVLASIHTRPRVYIGMKIHTVSIAHDDGSCSVTPRPIAGVFCLGTRKYTSLMNLLPTPDVSSDGSPEPAKLWRSGQLKACGTLREQLRPGKKDGRPPAHPTHLAVRANRGGLAQARRWRQGFWWPLCSPVSSIRASGWVLEQFSRPAGHFVPLPSNIRQTTNVWRTIFLGPLSFRFQVFRLVERGPLDQLRTELAGIKASVVGYVVRALCEAGREKA